MTDESNPAVLVGSLVTLYGFLMLFGATWDKLPQWVWGLILLGLGIVILTISQISEIMDNTSTED